MTTLKNNSEFKLTFNNSNTYMVIDNQDDCLKTFKSEKAVLNYFNKVSKLAGC